MDRFKAAVGFYLGLTVLFFVVYRTPSLLYLGLAFVVALMIDYRDNKVEISEFKVDKFSIAGIALILISPVFLFVKFGEYPSPSITFGLILIGSLLVIFGGQSKNMILPLGIAILNITLAVWARLNLSDTIEGKLSFYLVKATMFFVSILYSLLSIPIRIHENVMIIRNSMVIVGSGCSGLDAMILYMLITLVLIYKMKVPKKESVLLLSGVIGVFFINVIRISLLGYIGYVSGISFLKLFHSHLGDLLFLLFVISYWWIILKRK